MKFVLIQNTNNELYCIESDKLNDVEYPFNVIVPEFEGELSTRTTSHAAEDFSVNVNDTIYCDSLGKHIQVTKIDSTKVNFDNMYQNYFLIEENEKIDEDEKSEADQMIVPSSYMIATYQTVKDVFVGVRIPTSEYKCIKETRVSVNDIVYCGANRSWIKVIAVYSIGE